MATLDKKKPSTYFIVPPRLGREDHIFQDVHGLTPVDDPLSADVVVFTGGGDIHPRIYGEKAHPRTSPSVDRDNRELDILNAMRNDQIKVGICRGAQLLCAYYGGSLWQDVDNHAGVTHPIYIIDDTFKKVFGKEEIIVNSIHHQMLRRVPSSWRVVAMTNMSKNKKAYATSACDNFDIEAAVSDKDRVCVIQSHPEMGHEGTYNFFNTMFGTFLENLP